MAKRIPLTTYVSEDMARQVEEIASEEDRSVASLLRLALLELLQRRVEAAA